MLIVPRLVGESIIIDENIIIKILEVKGAKVKIGITVLKDTDKKEIYNKILELNKNKVVEANEDVEI